MMITHELSHLAESESPPGCCCGTAVDYGRHVGQRSVAQLPVHRGFNRSLGFLTGAENHFTQAVSDPTFGGTIDLWEDDHPAWGQNGTYGTYIYTREAIATIDRFAPQLLMHRHDHDRSMIVHDDEAEGEGEGEAEVKGLFIYMAWQDTHSPLQVPTSYCYAASAAAGGGPGSGSADDDDDVDASATARAPVGAGPGSGAGSALHASISNACPSEGPHIKGHSFCYCYNNQSTADAAVAAATAAASAEAGAPAGFAPAAVGRGGVASTVVSDVVDVGVHCDYADHTNHDNNVATRGASASGTGREGDGTRSRVHGNTTNGGDNGDRHTYNAMARIMDQGMANLTNAIKRIKRKGRIAPAAMAMTGAGTRTGTGAGAGHGGGGDLWSETLIVFSADK